MDNLEWIIKYENESTNLDFKKEQYRKEKYHSLLKDMMAMANAPIPGPRYIVIGVKHKPDGTKEYHPVTEISDQADIENIIQDNIEPIIKFQYLPLLIDHTQLVVIKIEEPIDPPYMMKKDYGSGLKQGDSYIRRGSKQARMTRRDLDELLSFRERNKFNEKIRLGFGESLTKEINFNATRINFEEFPSYKQKEFYQKKLRELEESLTPQKSQDETVPLSKEKELFTIRDMATRIGKIGIDLNSNIRDNSILIGRNQYAMPIYLNKEELEERIGSVEKKYTDEDNYFLEENCSEKLNFSIFNDGDSFLEDVNIIFYFPKEYCLVVANMPVEPVSSGPHNFNIHINAGYPDVSELNEFYIVEENIKHVRHKQLSQVFTEELRVLFKPLKENESIEIRYEVHARNLPSPQKGTLKINLKNT